MVVSYHSSMDLIPGSCIPQVELTDSLMGLIYDPLEAPESDIAALLNSVPMAHQNEEPKASPVLTLNTSSLTSPSIHSLHQDPYHTNAQNSKYAPNPFLNHHQTCNNHFSTTSSTTPVNFLNQNPGFPVGPCTGTMQGMVVPAVKSVSAQSVAGRARRKKISGKTRELAKLIPGGTRMNTAEMLLAAFKYVKFLQAQTSILAMMDSKEAREAEEYMRVLLGSKNMQEYLSSNGKCLVPIKLVMNLTQEMKSSIVVSGDVSRFVKTISS